MIMDNYIIIMRFYAFYAFCPTLLTPPVVLLKLHVSQQLTNAAVAEKGSWKSSHKTFSRRKVSLGTHVVPVIQTPLWWDQIINRGCAHLCVSGLPRTAL